MKFSLKGYFEPVPVLARKIGDALLASSSFIVTYSIINNYKSIAVTALIMGIVGKFLTNFFNEPVNK